MKKDKKTDENENYFPLYFREFILLTNVLKKLRYQWIDNTKISLVLNFGRIIFALISRGYGQPFRALKSKGNTVWNCFLIKLIEL